MRISDWSSDVCSSDLKRSAAPIGHHRAAPVKAEHTRHRPAAITHGQYVGIVAKGVEHRVEQRLGEHRRPQVTDTCRIDAIMIAAFARIARSEEHTSELQSLMRISYAVFCLKKKKPKKIQN